MLETPIPTNPNLAFDVGDRKKIVKMKTNRRLKKRIYNSRIYLKLFTFRN
jgi:hypothetical protein